MVFTALVTTAVVQDFSYDPSRAVRAANAALGGYSKYAADAIGDGAAFDPTSMASSDEKWILAIVIGTILWSLFSLVRKQRALNSAAQALADRAISNRKVRGAKGQRIKEQAMFRELKDPMAREIAIPAYRADLAVGASEETERAEKATKDYSAKYGEPESHPPKGKGKNKKKKKY